MTDGQASDAVGSDGTSSGTASPVAQPSSSGPTSSPTETTTVSELGQTRVGTNADVTLLKLRKVPAPPEFAPPADHEWAGVRARVCMHPEASPSGGLPWSSWT